MAVIPPAAAPETPPPPTWRRRSLFFLGLAVAAVGLTMAMQMGLNENFLVQEVGVRPLQRGILESVRETCGVTALVVLAVVAGVAEPLVAAAVLVLVGAALSVLAALRVPKRAPAA